MSKFGLKIVICLFSGKENMRLFSFFLCLYVLVCVGYVQAQTSVENATAISSLISPQIVLKDVSVKDTLKNNVKGTDTPKESPWKEKDIQFNVKDSSVKGRFIYRLEPRVWRFGFEVGGKSANGYTGLFDGSNISSDIRTDIFVIRGWLPKNNDTPSEVDAKPFVRGQWFGCRVGYRHGEYKLVSSDIPTPSGFRDQKLRGWAGLMHYSMLIPWKFFTGVSIGCASQNNYSKLHQVKVIDTTILDASDKNSLVTQTSVTARDGEYEDFSLLSADIDLLWMPNLPEGTSNNTSSTQKGFNKTIGLGAFLRVTRGVRTTSMSGITWEPGLGFYLFDRPDKEESSEESFISKMSGGIIVRYDIAETDIKFGLITSYNF